MIFSGYKLAKSFGYKKLALVMGIGLGLFSPIFKIILALSKNKLCNSK